MGILRGILFFSFLRGVCLVTLACWTKFLKLEQQNLPFSTQHSVGLNDSITSKHKSRVNLSFSPLQCGPACCGASWYVLQPLFLNFTSLGLRTMDLATHKTSRQDSRYTAAVSKQNYMHENGNNALWLPRDLTSVMRDPEIILMTLIDCHWQCLLIFSWGAFVCRSRRGG